MVYSHSRLSLQGGDDSYDMCGGLPMLHTDLSMIPQCSRIRGPVSLIQVNNVLRGKVNEDFAPLTSRCVGVLCQLCQVLLTLENGVQCTYTFQVAS